MNIFTLVGSILVDSDKASESIGKTEEKAGGFAQKLGGVIGTAGKVGLAVAGAAAAGFRRNRRRRGAWHRPDRAWSSGSGPGRE